MRDKVKGKEQVERSRVKMKHKDEEQGRRGREKIKRREGVIRGR